MLNYKWLKSVGTPVTIFGSLIVMGSGLFMFYAFKNHLIEEVHGQIGIVFTLGVILHVLANWRPLVQYLKKIQSYLAIIPMALIIAFLVINNDQKKLNLSPGIIFSKMEASSVSTLSLLFKIDQSSVKIKFEKFGIKVDNDNQTIAEIAKLNNRNPKEVIGLFLK